MLENSTLIDVIKHLGRRPFHTADFIAKFRERNSLEWQEIVEQYGMGGRGAGTHYSAYSRVSQALHHLALSGQLIKLDYAPAPREIGWGSPVIRFWTDDPNAVGQLYPDEVSDEDLFSEGERLTVTVNRYERNPAARQKCLEHHGFACSACGADFGARYGNRGAGFIHVHHLIPLKEIGERHEVDPIKDLRPVCPNCHAMIHVRDPMLSIEDLRKILDR